MAAILVLAGLLGLAALAPAAAFAGSISGTVTDAVSLEPVEGLEVCAYPLAEEEEEVWVCEATGTNGEYTIEDLEAGEEYGVEFWGRPLNYVPQYFDGKSHRYEWDPVAVGSEPVSGIDAAMVEGGEIEGTVDRAVGGAPVEAAFVCAWTIASEEFGGCAETDSSGEYAIRGMSEDEYEVEFWAEEQGLLTQYYDHQDHWWEANPVLVTLGAVTPGIDADLLPMAKIEGQVRRASDGSPLSEVEVCAWSAESEGGARCAYPEADGRYSIGGLPSDEYKVEFWPFDESLPIQYWDHKATWESANPFSLGAGSVVTGIDADLGPGPPPAPVVKPPVAPRPVASKPKPKRCKKGFRKKRVHGKVRCVKKKRAHRRHRHPHGRPAVRDRATFRLGR